MDAFSSHKVITFFATSLAHAAQTHNYEDLHARRSVARRYTQSTSVFFASSLMYKTKTAMKWKNHQDL